MVFSHWVSETVAVCYVIIIIIIISMEELYNYTQKEEQANANKQYVSAEVNHSIFCTDFE